MNIKRLYPNGKKKAATFSFDDGHDADIPLLQIFNKYGAKGTFNIPSFNMPQDENCEKYKSLAPLYEGHEIASHSFHHKHMCTLSHEENVREIADDIAFLSKAFGQNIRGYASPFGEYNEEILGILAENGICYHRNVNLDKTFSLPERFLDWTPGPHFAYYSSAAGREYLHSFLATDKELACLYVWGHSFEVVKEGYELTGLWNGLASAEKRWDYIENELIKPLAGCGDVWFATNIEIYDYITAMRSCTVGNGSVSNPSDTELWFEFDGTAKVLKPHETVNI